MFNAVNLAYSYISLKVENVVYILSDTTQWLYLQNGNNKLYNSTYNAQYTKPCEMRTHLYWNTSRTVSHGARVLLGMMYAGGRKAHTILFVVQFGPSHSPRFYLPSGT